MHWALLILLWLTFWPIALSVLIFIPIVRLVIRLAPKLFFKIINAAKENKEKRRKKKEAKLLVAYEAGSLQAKRHELTEIHRRRQETERELAELKRKEEEFEARHASNYREPAVVPQNSRVALPELDMEMEGIDLF